MTKEEAIKTLEKSMECHDRKVCGITETCEECPLYTDKDMEYEAHKVLLECLKESDEVLGKIRVEIESEMKWGYATGDDQYAEGFEKSLEVIDRYKAEIGD